MQRLRDVRFTYGWIETIDPHSVRVFAPSSMPLQMGDSCAFEVFGDTEIALFTGQFIEVADSSNTPPAASSSIALLEFRIASVMTFKPAEQMSRRLVSNCKAMVCDPIAENVEVHDISESGIGFLGTHKYKTKTAIEVVIRRALREVKLAGTVRYSRPESMGDGMYRTGVELSALGRLELAKWRSFVAEL